ncbi:AMP-binding protein [Oceaniglobus indicus]|uniref:AMP-binding protein n=1 Tax=Oceaniglobus indicus TaxID=2047749 RepID=UPI000C187D7C|nr:AMP-binding protein [Oceaniglobus indicus]
MDDLPTAFARAAERYGARTALIGRDGSATTFAALQDRVQALAAGFRHRGVKPGDRALVAMPVGPDLYASLAALWTLGATAVLPEPAMGLRGLRDALRAAPVSAFCASGPYRLLRAVMPGLWGTRMLTPADGIPNDVVAPVCTADDVALISFTSGSTGTPKAIARSHRFLMAQRRAVAPLLHSDHDEIDLVAFPVFVLVNLGAGRTSVLPDWPMRKPGRATPAALSALIERHGVTRALLPPALCERLAETAPPAHLATLFTGGGPIFPDLVARLRAVAPDLRIVSVYGSTEAEPIAEIDAADTTDADRAAMARGHGLLAGHPAPGITIRIEDDEILVAGDHVVSGYLDPARDVETKRRIDGTLWHRTGDAGRLDEDGRLWLLGRIGGRIKTAKGALYPFSVETAARSWPGVRHAALAQVDGKAVLAIEGVATSTAGWTDRAAALGIDRVAPVARIPMDRRHRSKVDHGALARLLR